MDFFPDYFDEISLRLKGVDTGELDRLADLLRAAHGQRKKVILAGNGGSAAMASHVAVDLTKAAGIRAVNFNETDLITCFANDYGYEHWVAKAMEAYADLGDVAVLISSSGRSANLVNAAKTAREQGLSVVTLTGFDATNPLRGLGDMNFWVDSHFYNVVEMTHHVWLVAVVDRIVSMEQSR